VVEVVAELAAKSGEEIPDLPFFPTPKLLPTVTCVTLGFNDGQDS
jgi:hypothetical protein